MGVCKWIVCALTLLQICAVLGFPSHFLAGSCPPVCACKWKSGKQTVECIDQALITVPELVDPETQVLDMSGNNLQMLPKETFARAGLHNLQRVYLRNCNLGQIHDLAFKGLTNLVELDLSHNLLTSVPFATFRDTPFLRDLTLAYNPIQKIDNNALKHVQNVVKLDLSHCELRAISQRAFDNLNMLESLKLNNNKLTELRPRSIEILKKLRAIEIHNNPWICDCRLRATKIWLTENNIPYPVAPVCASGPDRVVDRTFAELHVDDFACKPEILPVSRYIEATTGENATIVCRAGAVPAANINWYWNGRLLVNNSAFSSYQKVYIFEDGSLEKKSSLVLTNAQETDSSEFYCVAENRAGNSEANFTLHVSLRTAGMATLGSGQIAGLSAALILLILLILLTILVLLLRLRGSHISESKTPGQVEVVVTANNVSIPTTCKSPTTPPAVEGTSNGRKPSNEINYCNPVQKPPRVSDIQYTTNSYDGRGSIITNGNSCVSPTTSAGNNPDLINDTKGPGSNELIAGSGIQITDFADLRPGSGEYSREASDSLYPSGLWEQNAFRDITAAVLSRATSTNMPNFYNDKTPIIGNISVEGSQEELGYASKTFPRNYSTHNGYPPDYGLPIPSSDSRSTGAPGPPPRTMRVWQRVPPVLPPVTALKRALVSSRSSPDEGYQEGCGTDV